MKKITYSIFLSLCIYFCAYGQTFVEDFEGLSGDLSGSVFTAYNADNSGASLNTNPANAFEGSQSGVFFDCCGFPAPSMPTYFISPPINVSGDFDISFQIRQSSFFAEAVEIGTVSGMMGEDFAVVCTKNMFPNPVAFEAFTCTVPITATNNRIAFRVPDNTSRTYYVDNILIEGSIVLDLDWVEMEAKTIDDKTHLSWKTAKEQAIKTFQIERSIGDSKNFVEIGEQIPTNTERLQHYQFIDKNPFPTSYYRIKALEEDGTYQYSKIVTVKINEAIAKLQIFPQPASNQANIGFYSKNNKPALLSIFNTQGVLVRKETIATIAGQQDYSINISDLPTGAYYLSINTSQKRQMSILLKK